jgi:hypothetical protein
MLNVIGYTARIVFSSLAQGGGPERNGIVFILPDLNGFVFISVAGSTSRSGSIFFFGNTDPDSPVKIAVSV